MAMKIANIAEFKNHLSECLAAVANGEQVEVRLRSAPIVTADAKLLDYPHVKTA